MDTPRIIILSPKMDIQPTAKSVTTVAKKRVEKKILQITRETHTRNVEMRKNAQINNISLVAL